MLKRVLPATQFTERGWANKQLYFFTHLSNYIIFIYFTVSENFRAGYLLILIPPLFVNL